jgi:hypothetical protein
MTWEEIKITGGASRRGFKTISRAKEGRIIQKLQANVPYAEIIREENVSPKTVMKIDIMLKSGEF